MKMFGDTGRTLELKLPEYRAIFYTDELRGKQVCRDDLWAVSTDELNGLHATLKTLITSCKEMLGVLEDFVIPQVDCESVVNPIIHDARAAIAKAEGK
jgi:hypothetical protein